MKLMFNNDNAIMVNIFTKQNIKSGFSVIASYQIVCY